MSFEFLNSRRGRTVTLYVTRLCSSARRRSSGDETLRESELWEFLIRWRVHRRVAAPAMCWASSQPPWSTRSSTSSASVRELPLTWRNLGARSSSLCSRGRDFDRRRRCPNCSTGIQQSTDALEEALRQHPELGQQPKVVREVRGRRRPM